MNDFVEMDKETLDLCQSPMMEDSGGPYISKQTPLFLSGSGRAMVGELRSRNVKTTKEGEHPTVDGVVNTGGRVQINLTETLAEPLAPGHYQLLYVVAGDHTTVAAQLQILEPATKILVTDLDGTLTSSEYASTTFLIGIPPSAYPGAAELLRDFYDRGYFTYYLTARPEWMLLSGDRG